MKIEKKLKFNIGDKVMAVLGNQLYTGKIASVMIIVNDKETFVHYNVQNKERSCQMFYEKDLVKSIDDLTLGQLKKIKM